MANQFLIFVIDDSTNSATPTEMEAIDAFSAADQDAAGKIALEGSQACNRKVELRPLLGNQESP